MVDGLGKFLLVVEDQLMKLLTLNSGPNSLGFLQKDLK